MPLLGGAEEEVQSSFKNSSTYFCFPFASACRSSSALAFRQFLEIEVARLTANCVEQSEQAFLAIEQHGVAAQ